MVNPMVRDKHVIRQNLCREFIGGREGSKGREERGEKEEIERERPFLAKLLIRVPGPPKICLFIHEH